MTGHPAVAQGTSQRPAAEAVSGLKKIPDKFTRRARTAAVVVLAALATGCWRPLAVQHEYFAPANGSVARISAGIQHTMSHHRARQAAQQACAAPMPAAPPAGPDLGSEAAHKALADLCAGRTARPPVAAYGAASNAYRRWVEDRVRDLPEASATAADAAGG